MQLRDRHAVAHEDHGVSQRDVLQVLVHSVPELIDLDSRHNAALVPVENEPVPQPDPSIVLNGEVSEEDRGIGATKWAAWRKSLASVEA